MKRRRISIRWHLFCYFLIVAAIILLFVGVVQIGHFEFFYKRIKERDIQNVTNKLSSAYGRDDFLSRVAEFGDEYDFVIAVVPCDEKKRSELYSIDSDDRRNSNIIFYTLDKTYEEFYDMSSDNGGKYIYHQEGLYRSAAKGKKVYNSDAKAIVGISLMTDSQGYEDMILVYTMLSPMKSTKRTMISIFIPMAIMIVVLAIIFAFVFAKVISRPIEKINDTAKKISRGKDEVDYRVDSYKEVSELSDSLTLASEQIKRSNVFQRDLIANTSHDLRTPLTMITAYAEVMRDIPGENNAENLQVIIDEASRLNTLVNDMLELSKLQAGVEKLAITEFNFTEAVVGIINRFSKFVDQGGYDIVFEKDFSVVVRADEQKIYQVIYNLINNAINYSGNSSKILIRQTVVEDKVMLEIVDYGPGIDENEIDNIWDRYYKIDKKHRRAIQGSGIGLSIVRDILILHNAEYGVKSKLGEGSTFWFKLDVVN